MPQFGPKRGERPIDWALEQRLRLEAEGFPKEAAQDAELFLFGWASGINPDGARAAYALLSGQTTPPFA
jgi:hypothetical protein